MARLPAAGWSVQLIIVDNDSHEEDVGRLLSWSAVNGDRFSEILLIAASLNLGFGGHNLAFKLATADQILILDNDLNLPDDAEWLNTLSMRMCEDARVGIVGPMLVFEDCPGVVQGAGIGLTERGQVGYLYRGETAERIPPDVVEVIASASACWLVRREAQRTIGFFADEFYPMQYGDVDFCVRLHLAGWRILCDRSVRIEHIENVTTRNLKDYPYARIAVRHGMKFRDKWARVLHEIATISQDDIYWGPIPRADD